MDGSTDQTSTQPEHWAKAEVADDVLTITVRCPRISNHHPSNLTGACVGLATVGVSLLIDTDEARTLLEGIARENVAARASQSSEQSANAPASAATNHEERSA